MADDSERNPDWNRKALILRQSPWEPRLDLLAAMCAAPSASRRSRGYGCLPSIARGLCSPMTHRAAASQDQRRREFTVPNVVRCRLHLSALAPSRRVERFGERVVVVIETRLCPFRDCSLNEYVFLNEGHRSAHARVILRQSGVDHALQACVRHRPVAAETAFIPPGPPEQRPSIRHASGGRVVETAVAQLACVRKCRFRVPRGSASC